MILLVMVATAGVVRAQQAAAPTASTEVAAIEWESQNFDFGKIKQGTPVTHEFKFTNTGKVPLQITNAQPSCGCTTPDWTRTAVAPGEKGFIKATFNAANPGVFSKSITVTANVTGNVSILQFKGEVVAASAVQ